jgi:hypothetical protein
MCSCIRIKKRYGLFMVYLSIVMSIYDWLLGLPWIDRNWRLKQ